MNVQAISNYVECGDAYQMLDGLPYRYFPLVSADVPWKYDVRSVQGLGKSAERYYRTMTLQDIARMPVERHAARDAFLLFWVTGPFLAIGAHIPIMKAWGFEPTAIWGVWVKPTLESWDQVWVELNDEIWKMGLGYTSRQNAEFVVIGRRGNPERLAKDVRQVIMAPLREHSRKPEKFFVNAQRFCAGPRLELFGRQQRKGWIVRGDQNDKFRA
jgi:N6-adenosine-specific RNA methylase IME4